MAYETNEAREAARKRLQERMERRSSSQTPTVPKTYRGNANSARTASAKPISHSAILAMASLLAIAVVLAISMTYCSTNVGFGDEAPLGAFGKAGGQDLPIDQEQAEEPFDEAAARAQLTKLIGQEETGKLIAQASDNDDARWIASHSSEYAAEGSEVQEKILKLAANEPSALEYVRNYPDQYPMDASNPKAHAMSTKSPSTDVPDTSVPHLYQWDMRWGYSVYSSAAFGLTGCGPTSMAMVVQAFRNGDDNDEGDIDPYQMGQIAKENGYMSEFNGTGNDFFTDMAGEFNLYCESLYPTGDSIVEALSSGAVIIANVGPGQFTEHGHFFVLAGLTDDERVIVNDPYSVERSSQTWDADTIADESIALFAFYA